jgi:hypothetical protein
MYFLIVLAVLFPADIFSLAFLILLSLFAETLTLIYIVISVIGKIPSGIGPTELCILLSSLWSCPCGFLYKIECSSWSDTPTGICAICIAMTSMAMKCTLGGRLEAFTVETNQRRGEKKDDRTVYRTKRESGKHK